MNDERIRVLLVEDDPHYSKLITHVMDRASGTFDLTHARRLSEALDSLYQGGIDVVLLDLFLPDAEGLDTFHSLHAAVPDIPILVLTGLDDRQMALRAVKMGAQDYLVKGRADLQWLPRSIGYAIERQRVQEERTKRISRLAVLSEVDDELTRRLDVDYVLTMAVDSALRLSAASAALIALIDNDGALSMIQQINYPVGALEDFPSLETGIIGRCLRERKPQLVQDVHADPDYIAMWEETVAQIAIPLLSQGRTVGFLNLETRSPDRFNPETFEFLKLLAARIAAAVDNARLYYTSQQQIAELKALYDKVRHLEQMKTDMLRIATHDLRNPLSHITGYIYLLQQQLEDGQATAETAGYLDAIAQAAERMRNITQDILSLERLEALGGIDAKALRLDELVERLYRDNQAIAEARHQRLHLELRGRPVTVLGESALLYEAMSNLLSNAIKYTPEGGDVAVRLHRKRKEAVFEVIDNGYGVPRAQQKRLFQAFFRASSTETEDIQGTGLGLHLVKNIISYHHGEVLFRSEYRKGSLFGFKLPLAPPGSEEPDANGRRAADSEAVPGLL